jgi:hypothetical protein
MSTPLTNHVTQAATDNGQPYITITSNGTPELTKIALSDGRDLGLIQSATWTLSIGEYASCHIETIASPAELKVWLKDTSISVRPAPGYNPFRYLWDWTCAWCYNLFTRS